MGIVLFDTIFRNQWLPLSLNHAIADVRMGIFTMKERWETITQLSVYIATPPYLQHLYGSIPHDFHFWIDARVFPFNELVEKILLLKPGEALYHEDEFIAGNFCVEQPQHFAEHISSHVEKKQWVAAAKRFYYLFQLLQHNAAAIQFDVDIIRRNKTSHILSNTNKTIHAENIFVEEGAVAEHCILNASEGIIYIGKNALIMEGSIIRGPATIGKNAVVKLGTKLYGATTIGPYCTCGGEIKNVIMQGYSNKAHDGYLGDSIIGSWCNFGAGTSCSNLKNTAGNIFMNDYATNQPINVGKKLGCMMGDYSRTAINTSINTGTITGICCNIFGNGLLNKTIPSFSWGSAPFQKYKLEKALNDIQRWKELKAEKLSAPEAQILTYLFTNSIL